MEDSEARAAIGRVANVVDENREAHNRLAVEVAQIRQREREAAAGKMLEAVSKLVTTTYERSVAYTNVVMIGGYAAFFALWSATKPVLSGRLALAAALMMTVSAAVFVFFEVVKMIQSSQFVVRHQGLLTDPAVQKDPEMLRMRLDEYEALRRASVLRLAWMWRVALWLTVPTAAIAVALLAGNYSFLLLFPPSDGGGL